MLRFACISWGICVLVVLASPLWRANPMLAMLCLLVRLHPIRGLHSILQAIERGWACLITLFCMHFLRFAPPELPLGGHGRAPQEAPRSPHDFGMQLGAQHGSMRFPDINDVSMVSIRFSGSPFILRFGPCFLRVLRSVKPNDDSRDVSVSHFPTFFKLKMQVLRGAAWLHTPTKRLEKIAVSNFTTFPM